MTSLRRQPGIPQWSKYKRPVDVASAAKSNFRRPLPRILLTSNLGVVFQRWNCAFGCRFLLVRPLAHTCVMSNDDISMGQRIDSGTLRESVSDRGSYCGLDSKNRNFRLPVMRCGRLEACAMVPGGF
jgi:hypothetical protein